MTRKRYQADVKDEMNEEEKMELERQLQKEYEEHCKKLNEETLTFGIKHFDQLMDMYENIKDNLVSATLLENCKFEDFCNFIETPSIYNPYEYCEDYNYELWNEEYGIEVREHYKIMKKYKIFNDRNVNLGQFKKFFYEFHHKKEIGRVTMIPREIQSNSWFYD